MKKYFCLILFAIVATLTFTTLSYGQANLQDVVYLKNGSIIRGIIMEQIPNQSLKIETADKSVFVYQMNEVEKIAKEPTPNKNNAATNATPEAGMQKGYKGMVELGYLIGVGDNKIDRIKLNIINGYQINPYISLGVGLGLRYYIKNGNTGILMPVFADIRTNFNDKKVSPYFALGVGYSINIADDFLGGGFLLEPSFGVSIKGTKKSAFNIGVSYEMQRLKARHYQYGYYYYDYYIENVSFGAIGLACGISF